MITRRCCKYERPAEEKTQCSIDRAKFDDSILQAYPVFFLGNEKKG